MHYKKPKTFDKKHQVKMTLFSYKQKDVSYKPSDAIKNNMSQSQMEHL